MPGSFRLGKIAGIEIDVHVSFSPGILPRTPAVRGVWRARSWS